MRISIITVSKNNSSGLEKTIASVISQRYQPYEHIVIDGGDDVKSKEVLEKYDNKILYLSEPDLGIYNAMNKGIDMCSGDYILFLNSGDHFTCENSLEFWVKKISNKNASIYFARILWHSFANHDLSVSDHNYLDKSWHLIYDNFPHSASMYQRKLFNDFGKYDESYIIMSDYEFNLRVLLNKGVTFHYSSLIVSTFYANGVSVDSLNKSIRDKENKLIREKYFNAALLRITKKNAFVSNSKYLRRILLSIFKSNLNRVY